MIYTQRLVRPEKGNKYYITKSAGGYSNAIVGKCKATGKPDPDCNTLANCVGYAYGRFNEIGKYGACKYLSPVNAENFPEYAKNCKQGSVPKLGAVIVWQKGATLKNSDGAGHVAIVEDIISDTQILISQSGYNSNIFWTETCTFKNGAWTCSWMNSAYKFRCFIYNPAIPDNIQPLLKIGNKNIFTKQLQQDLNKIGNYNLVVDGSFGQATDTAVKDFQKKNKLTIDGIVGEATQVALSKAVEKATRPANVNDLQLILNGKQVSAWGLMANGQNYIRLVDLEELGIVNSVTYNTTKKLPEIKTKC